jgi:hypothetical protein
MANEDFPLAEIGEACQRVIAGGGFILQKWTCEKCRRRLMASNVNVLVHRGHCEHCNHVTDLDRYGCNFAMITPSRPMTVAEIEIALGLAAPGIH